MRRVLQAGLNLNWYLPIIKDGNVEQKEYVGAGAALSEEFGNEII